MGTPLLDWRVGCGKSQGDVARILKTTQSDVSRIERGLRPLSLEMAVLLERATGIPAAKWFKVRRTRRAA
jgi:transcriptional regulator with XRE-family HTH domain